MFLCIEIDQKKITESWFSKFQYYKKLKYKSLQASLDN